MAVNVSSEDGGNNSWADSDLGMGAQHLNTAVTCNGNDYEVVATVNPVFRWSSVFIRLWRFLTGRPNRLCAVNAA